MKKSKTILRELREPDEIKLYELIKELKKNPFAMKAIADGDEVELELEVKALIEDEVDTFERWKVSLTRVI